MKRQMDCLIVDDEPLAREGIFGYVKQVDFLLAAGEASDAVEALGILNQRKIDLMFLDIQMPKMNGLDLLKSIADPPLVILTTAYPSFALEGYQLNVLDYLLKPITFQRFLKAVSKAKKQFDLLYPFPEQMAEESHIFIKTEGRIERIGFDELLFLESMQNYVHFHTSRGKFTTLTTLKNVIRQLPDDQFLHVHKSFVVRKEKIITIDGNVLQIGTHRIPISRSRFDFVVDELLKGKLLK